MFSQSMKYLGGSYMHISEEKNKLGGSAAYELIQVACWKGKPRKQGREVSMCQFHILENGR